MPYPATKTYWLEWIGEIAWGFRRYKSADDCADGSYHNAVIYAGRREVILDEYGYRMQPDFIEEGPWPLTCDKCPYVFLEGDEKQMWSVALYRRADTGAIVTIEKQGVPDAEPAAPGATWDAWWLPWKGPDDVSLMVKLPNGHQWCVDSQASNCTKPEDRIHRCWVRDGTPRLCDVTAGKAGNTCSAGAGSILAGDYHGFLRGGLLTSG